MQEMFQIGECGKYFVKNLPRLSVVARRALNDRRIERSHAGDGDALRESQEDFRGPVEASTEFVWTAAEDGTSSDLFRWFSQVSGRTIDDLDGIASLIHPADLEPIRSMWASSGTEGKLFEITARFLTKYGEYMYYVVRSIPIHNEDGTFRHWVGTFTDVNEQLAAIEHLRKSENHLRAMVESDPKCVKVLDREGRLVTINPAGVRMMEADSQDAIVGTAVCELVIPEHRDKFNAMIAGAFEGKEASQVFEIVGLKGSHRILESHVVPLRGRDGDIVSALGVTQDITEQRRREETLRQQAMLLDQAWEAIFVWNFDDGIVEWNKGSERLYGYNRDEAKGRESAELLQTELPISREEFRERLISDGYWNGQLTHIAKDGRRIRSETRCQLVDIGQRKLVLQTNRDITERVAADENLRSSEKRYRALFDLNPYPMWVYDSETLKFLAVNAAAVKEYGYSEEEFGAMTIVDIRPVEEVPNLMKRIKPPLGPAEFSGESRHRKKNGDVMMVEITSHRTEFEGREARIVLSHDITERVETQKALAISEEKYRDLFENANDLIYTHDLSGNFLSLNRAGELILGYTVEEALKKNVRDVIDPRTLPSVRKMLETKLTGQASAVYDLDVLAKDGRYVSLEVNSRLVIQDGKAVGVQGIGRDVSARKATEEALRSSEEQLIQVQKLESIGILAGGMAHDFNNMLTAINGYSDLVLRRLSEDDPNRRNVEEIRKAGERSADLTKQLLAFSRRQILLPKILDVNDVIRETSGMLGRIIGEDIEISTVLDPDLSPVEADPGQIGQVLMNLAVNARDAMPNGGTIVFETRNVRLDGEYAGGHVGVKPGQYVMLAVSDTGMGMDEATQDRVFEPFFTTKVTGEGTGLGLSTVYGIVKQSNGNIWVYSEPGHGTTFKIYLPFAHDVIGAPVKMEPIPSSEGSETILLVEDEELVRKLSREILESCGYTIVEAANGVEAIEMCKDPSIKFDLLITDVVMPQMGGRELATRLISERPGTRVLFTSGYTDDAMMRHSIIDEGMNFIAKPFSSNSLARAVRSLLDH